MKYLCLGASLISKKKSLINIVIVTLAIFVSGCQTTSPISEAAPNSLNYSHYYLWLKTLDNKQLIAEEQIQKTVNTNKSQIEVDVDTALVNQGKLILIYSLSNSTLHQPYKAKRLLNSYLLSEHSLNKDNLAFISLLRDQLNTQLFLLQNQEKLTKALNKFTENHNEVIHQLTLQLNQKDIDLERVNKQLKLLKKIDQRIEQRS
jgi:hypothetical protein